MTDPNDPRGSRVDESAERIIRELNTVRKEMHERTSGELPNQKLSTTAKPQFAAVRLTPLAAASLPAGAAQNGLVYVDLTNNRLVYYSGGLRYYVAGTSF